MSAASAGALTSEAAGAAPPEAAGGGPPQRPEPLWSQRIAYDPGAVPRPFGLENTGVICYFNGFLQALASCPAFVAAAVARRDYLGRTETGACLYNFLRAVEESSRDPAFVVDPSHSRRVLQALVADLGRRRPRAAFGQGMESATEALVHFLDMLEPEGDPDPPLARHFTVLVKNYLWCAGCAGARSKSAGADTELARAKRGVVSEVTDTLSQYNYFHYDEAPPATPQEFSDRLELYPGVVEDYVCERCTAAGRPRSRTCKVFRVTDASSVVVVVFNQYQGHRLRFFPPTITVAGGKYIRVAQIEHSGSLAGGHYWTAAYRQPPAHHKKGVSPVVPFELNDAHFRPAQLQPQPTVYAVFYHYVCPADAKMAGASPAAAATAATDAATTAAAAATT